MWWMRVVRSVRRSTVELRPQPADRFHERAPVDAEVAGVHAREKRIGVPVRLEERVGPLAVVVDLVFVGVEHVDVGHTIGGERALEERVRRQEIVVIEEAHELALRERQRRIARARDVAVLTSERELDAPLEAGVLLEDPADAGIARCVVGDAQFPIGIHLRAHRIEGRAQVAFRRIVGRHDHAEERPPRHDRHDLAHLVEVRPAHAEELQEPLVWFVRVRLAALGFERVLRIEIARAGEGQLVDQPLERAGESGRTAAVRRRDRGVRGGHGPVSRRFYERFDRGSCGRPKKLRFFTASAEEGFDVGCKRLELRKFASLDDAVGLREVCEALALALQFGEAFSDFRNGVAQVACIHGLVETPVWKKSQTRSSCRKADANMEYRHLHRCRGPVLRSAR